MMGRNLMANETLEKVQRLSVLASECGLTMSQFALAWCLRHHNVASVIIGATKVAQIDENVKAAGVKLSPEILEKVEVILGAATPARA
jgi:aryl-alcohol dehydrogenase-like predicted oxidoreductase